jgi:hypothetical protein
MAKIKIRKSRSVPYILRILGTVALTASFGYLLDHLDEQAFIPAAIALSPLLPMLWMSVQILEINDDENYWWKYHWILGYKYGRKITYEKLDHMSLEKIMVKPKRQPEEPRYELFLHFNKGQPLKLTRRKKLVYIREKAQQMAEKVDLQLVDNIED